MNSRIQGISVLLNTLKGIKKDRRIPFKESSVLAPESYTNPLIITCIIKNWLSPLVAVKYFFRLNFSSNKILQRSPETRPVRVFLPERFIVLYYLLLRRRFSRSLPVQSSAHDSKFNVQISLLLAIS